MDRNEEPARLEITIGVVVFFLETPLFKNHVGI